MFRVTKMCQALKVSRSGYYHWLREPVSQRKIEDMKLKQKITEIYIGSRKTYGSLKAIINSIGNARENSIVTSIK